jgi:ArsR family transcriptional regulator, nickel/cobalt-responsive transcriptional repressor
MGRRAMTLEPAAARPMSAKTAEEVADVMFALSSPNRVRILGLLRERHYTVGELMDALEMEQSAVSHQLRVLREHNLVRATELGRQRVYALSGERVGALVDDAVEHVSRISSPSAGRRAKGRLRRAR